MRLLLALLALLTGFTAAEAARPVESSAQPAAALQADFSETVTSAAVAIASYLPQPSIDAASLSGDKASYTRSDSPPQRTPVSSADRARE